MLNDDALHPRAAARRLQGLVRLPLLHHMTDSQSTPVQATAQPKQSGDWTEHDERSDHTSERHEVAELASALAESVLGQEHAALGDDVIDDHDRHARDRGPAQARYAATGEPPNQPTP